jgi:hypothetical protein
VSVRNSAYATAHPEQTRLSAKKYRETHVEEGKKRKEKLRNKRREELTQAKLQEVFTLDEETGVLYWRNPPAGTAGVGDVAGGMGKKGRWIITFDGKRRLRSRLVFFYFYGWLPSLVDHRDRNKLNDRPDNLRPASSSQNQWNRQYKAKASGLPTRVSMDKRCPNNPFRSYIGIEGKDYFLGNFPTVELAFSASIRAAQEWHGEFFVLPKFVK